MFVGHYGAAFVAKGIEPRTPLWALLLAVQWVDVMWAIFVFVGIEHARLDPTLPGLPLDLEHMPFTHSLVATAVWGAFGYVVARRALAADGRIAAVIAAAVASHWFLDLLVHRPDLPLVWGDPKLGFGLWNYPLLELAIEIGWLLATVVFVTRAGLLDEATRARVWKLAIGLAVLQVAMAFGPVPPALLALVASAFVVYLVVPWIGTRVDPA
ncbi:MAG: hypothetical protein ACREQQ_19120 [Candidatus Binatia bacterium]